MKSVLDRRPLLVAIAGPNGAGKSTFYSAHLAASGLRFVNADELASALNVNPYRAAEVADQIRRELVARNESFIFETVFSDPVGGEIAFLKEAERRGYTVVLIFIGLDGAGASEHRVAMRVLKGGHDVPSDKIATRYGRVMANLRTALRELPYILVYDNSNLGEPYRMVAKVEARNLQAFPPTPEWLRPLLPKQ